MKLKLDTSGSNFLVSKEPEPVLDPNTNIQKLDKEGRPIYLVQLVWLSENGAEVLPVKTSGKPISITTGSAVKVIGLAATPWSMGDRNGVSFSAERVEAVTK
ncbi:MAG: hypothetical protein ACYDHP_04840 [Ferrimicrobium sp.]